MSNPHERHGLPDPRDWRVAAILEPWEGPVAPC